MLTRVAASSASSLVAISSSQSSTNNSSGLTTTTQLNSVTDTTNSSPILRGGRKKARKTNPGLLQRALEANCEIVINPPIGNGNKKRSRKQKISTLSDAVDEVSPVTKSEAKTPRRRRATKRKVGGPSKKSAKKGVASESIVSSESALVPFNTAASESSLSAAHDRELISDINFTERIYSNLRFQRFGDVTRHIVAISPSSVVVAVETTAGPGSLNEINREDGLKPPNCGNHYSLYKTSPHFLDLTASVYARSEPFARILAFSHLEEYTCKALKNNTARTFRFHGPRFERGLQDTPHEDIEKNRKHNGYRPADLIIKHPLLGFYHRNFVNLKFIIVKRVSAKNTELAIIKTRIVQLRRTEDLKNIEIFVDECDINEKALDVNAMNQRNIQPVIQSANGLLPVITNSNSYLPSNHSYQHQAPQYHYVHYQYQEPIHQLSFDDSTSNITNSYLLNDNNNTPVIRAIDYPGSTIYNENGTRVLILNHNHSLSSVPSNYIQTHQQQIIQEGPSFSQLVLPEQLNARIQLQPEPQQQQQQLIEQSKQLVIPSKIGQIIVDSSQLANLQSRTNVPVRLIHSTYPLESSGESNSATLYTPSQQIQKLPTQQIQYQSNYTSNLQQQVSSSVQIQPQLQQNFNQGNSGQTQYTFQSHEVVNSQPGHQDQQFLQQQLHAVQHQLQIQPPAQQITPQQQHQTVITDLTQINPFKQSLSLQPQQLEPQPEQNFQYYSTPPVPVTQSQQQSSAPLTTSQPAPVIKQKGVKQPKRSSKKSKAAAASHQPVPLPTSLTEQQLQQLQQRSKSGSVYDLGTPIQSLPSPLHSPFASSSPSTVLLKAPKSQTPSTSSSHATVPALSSPPTVPALSASSTGPKLITVIQSTPKKTVESTAAVRDNRPAKKEGFLAVCPSCGVCSSTVIRCIRCKREFPEDIRLIPDGFKVSKTDAAVVSNKTVASSVPGSASDKASGTIVSVSSIKTLATPQQKFGGNSGARKIVIVNKPALLGGVVGKTPSVATGTVHVAIQQDGGSSVTILNSNSSKSASKPSSKPIPKKRPQRKRQQELITLSSDDDDESDSQAKLVTSEEKVSTNSEAPCGSSQQSSASTDLEVSEETLSCASSTSTPNNMARKKGIAINLSPDICSPSKKMKWEETQDQDQTPEKIYDEISRRMAEPGCKFKYAMVHCRSVRIGSFKVTSSDTGYDIPVTFTELGIKFTLQHANFKHKQMKVCIPLNVILDMTAHLNKKLPVIFISTGPKYARSMRETLGMDGNPESESSNYFCPQNGRPSQKKITLVASDIADADVGIIKSIYNLTLNEIDYSAANALLMSITPNTFRSSISYNTDSPGSPPTPKIVSTSSVAPGSNNSTVVPASSSTVASSSSSISGVPGTATVGTPADPGTLKLTEKVKKRTPDEGTMSAGERRHARVKKRTKNVDIFEKDFLIVPINENYHWFIAIICFPGLQGYHDYESLELLPNFKRAKLSNRRTVTAKPIVYNQPKSESTASYSNRDEAPEDPEEMESQMSTEPEDDCSSPMESKLETDSNHKSGEGEGKGGGLKRKLEFGQRIKHPCILIFDSLAGDARGRVFSTLREYLKIEYKTKKQVDRVFDKTTMPGCMPKVPQQPNFSDCGLFMLQYVESFFSSPIQNYDTTDLSLKNWFQTSIAENKRREIYDFILKKVDQLYPQNLGRIPTVNFEAGEDDQDLVPEPDSSAKQTDDDDSDDLLEPITPKTRPRRRKSDSDDHTYAKGKLASNSDAKKE